MKDDGGLKNNVAVKHFVESEADFPGVLHGSGNARGKFAPTLLFQKIFSINRRSAASAGWRCSAFRLKIVRRPPLASARLAGLNDGFDTLSECINSVQLLGKA